MQINTRYTSILVLHFPILRITANHLKCQQTVTFKFKETIPKPKPRSPTFQPYQPHPHRKIEHRILLLIFVPAFPTDHPLLTNLNPKPPQIVKQTPASIIGAELKEQRTRAIATMF